MVYNLDCRYFKKYHLSYNTFSKVEIQGTITNNICSKIPKAKKQKPTHIKRIKLLNKNKKSKKEILKAQMQLY